MEIKYEAVFGDQSLFDDAEPDVVLAETNGVYRTFHKESDKPYDVASVSRSDLAMRRIIRTPTWTVADHKTGKLPEVGAKFLYKDEELCCHYVDSNGEIWANNFKGEVVTPLLREITPIESPEEKAARLRDEFVESTCRQNEPHSTLYSDGVRAAYRKLKGGDHD